MKKINQSNIRTLIENKIKKKLIKEEESKAIKKAKAKEKKVVIPKVVKGSNYNPLGASSQFQNAVATLILALNRGIPEGEEKKENYYFDQLPEDDPHREEILSRVNALGKITPNDHESLARFMAWLMNPNREVIDQDEESNTENGDVSRF